MTKRLFRPVCLAAAALFVTVGAHASELKGSFTGTAINSFIGSAQNDPASTTFNGTAITGTFDFIGGTADILTSNPASYFADFGVDSDSQLTFNLLGSSVAGTYTYHLPATPNVFSDRAQLKSSATGELVSILSQEIPGDDYTDSALNLAGTGFFDLATPSNLHPGTVNLPASTTNFAFGERFTFGTGIQLTSVTFDTPVPEPASIALTLTGLATLAGLRLRRRGKTEC